jgi:hypothetical protein
MPPIVYVGDAMTTVGARARSFGRIANSGVVKVPDA